MACLLSPCIWLSSHKNCRASPAPHPLQHLGEKVLHLAWQHNRATLLQEVRMIQSPNSECRRAVPTSNLSCKGMGRGEMPSLSFIPHLQWQTRELTLPISSFNIQKSRPCCLSGQHNRRTDPVGGNEGELVLVMFMWDSWPHHTHLQYGGKSNVNMPSSTCTYHMCWAKDQIRPSLLPAIAIGKVGPSSCLSRIVELTLLTWVQVNQPQNLELGWCGSSPHLPYGDVGRGEMFSPCLFPPAAGGTADPEVLRVRELCLSLSRWNALKNRHKKKQMGRAGLSLLLPLMVSIMTSIIVGGVL